MATLTKSVPSISGSGNYSYQCVVTENSYNVSNNTSNVTITFSVKGPWSPSFYDWSTSYGIIVDGTVKKTGSSSPSISTSYVQLTSWTGNISHGADGSKNINVGVYLYHSGPSSYLPTQYTSSSPLSMGSVKLTTIPRASSLSLSATSVNVGSSITASISRASTSFTHTVEFYINSTYYQKYTGVATSQSFTIPYSWYSAMPSSTSCTAYCRITTYNGNTQIGSQVKKSFTVQVPSSIKPAVGTITLDPVDIITQDGVSRNILVKGKNKLNINVANSSSGTGSTILSYTYSGQNVSSGAITSASATSSYVSTSVINPTISGASSVLTYTVEVADNRNRSNSKTATIECYNYSNPTFTSFSAYRVPSDTSTTEDSNGTYIYCSYTAQYAYVNNTNKVFSLNLSGVSSSNVGTWNTSTSTDTDRGIVTVTGYTWITNCNVNTSYTLKAALVDNYGGTSNSSSKMVFSVERVLNIRPNGSGMAFGKIASTDNFLDSKWPIKTDDPAGTMRNLTFKGSNILSISEDTTATWVGLGNLTTAYYNTEGKLNGQPSKAGYAFNITAGVDSTQLHQIWTEQPNGSLYHRGGNTSGTPLGSWKTILDSSNYATYVSPKPVSLYSPSSGGTTGDVTLLESAANYEYLEIFYTDTNNADAQSVRVMSPNGKTIDLSCIGAVGNQKLTIMSSRYKIETTKLTFVRFTSATLTNGVAPAITDATDKSSIKVLRVVGLK